MLLKHGIYTWSGPVATGPLLAQPCETGKTVVRQNQRLLLHITAGRGSTMNPQTSVVSAILFQNLYPRDVWPDNSIGDARPVWETALSLIRYLNECRCVQVERLWNACVN